MTIRDMFIISLVSLNISIGITAAVPAPTETKKKSSR